MAKYLLVELEMETRSPLFTGEIKQDMIPPRGPRPVRKTADGRVAVPVYGAMRAYLEKVLRSNGEQVCDAGKRPCGHCVLCDLFGSLGRGGRALIDDLVSEEPAKKIVHPSTHVRINRETNSVADALQLEEVEEGARFRGKILIDDPTNRDLELIQTAVEAINDWGLGGWRTRGRGRVSMRIARVEELSWSDYAERARQALSGGR